MIWIYYDNERNVNVTNNDPQVTYLSLLVGDGDNIAFMRGGRRGWMKDRLAYCKEQVTKTNIVRS